MSKNTLVGAVALLGAALIWGLAFSAQKTGMKYLTPELFTSLRSFIGVAVLFPAIAVIGRIKKTPLLPADKKQRTHLIAGGIWCGVVLSFASTTQQYGLIYSSAGKAGFITSLYIVFVPLAGVFFRHRISCLHWIAVVLALSGSWLLCSPGTGDIGKGDIWLLACAFLFTAHILVIGHYAPGSDCLKLSCIQFFTAGVITGAAAIIKHDTLTCELLHDCLFALLYCGVCSSGIAFTLQMISQKYIAGATASILMSMESVFSVVGGYIFLGERLAGRELAGCLVILLAVISAQLKVGGNPSGKESV